MAKMTMTIEPVSAFNGLDVLVARDEGLFTEEGLDLQIATRAARDISRTEDGTLSQPATGQGRLLDRREAEMFQG